MNRLALLAIALIAPAAMAAPVLPVLVDFDDIDASVDVPVPDGYRGFVWTELLVYQETPGFPGFNNGISSSPNAVYGGYSGVLNGAPGVEGSISSPEPFDFVSGIFGAGYYDDLLIQVTGFRNGIAVVGQQFVVEASLPALEVTFVGFQSVDMLKIVSQTTDSTTDPFSCGDVNCTHFTIDNLSFAPPTTPIPLPGAAWLLGGGLLALGGVASRRRPGLRGQ
jgi:hypothetical protein